MPRVIAVVDDDPRMLDLFARLLARARYVPILWSTGPDAFRMIRKCRPDLVILDLQMEDPQAGWRTLRQMRQDHATQAIPVLICSVLAPFDRRMMERLSGWHCAVLPKPFRREQLEAKIAELLSDTS